MIDVEILIAKNFVLQQQSDGCFCDFPGIYQYEKQLNFELDKICAGQGNLFGTMLQSWFLNQVKFWFINYVTVIIGKHFIDAN